MGRKKNSPKTEPATAAGQLPPLRIGSRVRCSDDGVEGRIVWANAASVKIEWDDGDQVTWKRADLAGKPITILDPTDDQAAAMEPSDAKAGDARADEPAQTSAKPKRQRKTPAPTKEKKLSALDAAARVLAESGQPMTCQEMIDAMAKKGYWTSPGGQTPAATLYSAILRELDKGAGSRFVKTDRGKFARKA